MLIVYKLLCHEHNHRSERVMIRIGMHKEGTLRGVRYLNSQWYGSHVYSILDTDHKKKMTY
jgi:[ribosomal protein S5]-alanine N-acetyltransferase